MYVSRRITSTPVLETKQKCTENHLSIKIAKIIVITYLNSDTSRSTAPPMHRTIAPSFSQRERFTVHPSNPIPFESTHINPSASQDVLSSSSAITNPSNSSGKILIFLAFGILTLILTYIF